MAWKLAKMMRGRIAMAWPPDAAHPALSGLGDVGAERVFHEPVLAFHLVARGGVVGLPLRALVGHVDDVAAELLDGH